ncbi:receptor-like protein EIX2 [Musa acuminata AAA Group]|uniref:receptor-like protein EIX2 n=1 Tax=Musa acuminata AAA Group TaxID=214697 RepID=UPI0031D7FB27
MAAAGSGSFQDGRIASKRLMMLVALLLVSCCLGHGFGDEDHVEVEGVGSSCMESERRALLAIKSDMYDPGDRFSSWTGKDCCGWRGVACDHTTGHVTKLDLHYSYTYDLWDISDIMETMGGSKVNPSLQELKHLKYLDLSMNNFSHAPVPKMIASLVHLEYLNLSYAMFDGPIPPQLGNLSNLHYLDLHRWYDDDFLHVHDLDWLSRIPSLKYLDMSFVNLSNATNWFYIINSIPALEVLRLSDADLPCVPSLLPPFNLTIIATLDLSWNSNITSAMLRWLSNATSLEYLLLSGCGSLTIESVQVALGALSNLKELDLSFNFLKGEIREILNNVSSSSGLKHLDLRSNQLSGDIPPGSLRDLEYLDLSWNSIVNLHIFASLGNLTNLRHLGLSANSISGEIPQTVGNFVRLEYLDLRWNQLSGDIPPGSLRDLEYLDLSWNSIVTLHILASLGNLTNLRHLDLGYNLISGEIPPTVGDSVRLEYLDLSNNGINGKIPQAIGNLSNLLELHLSGNKIVGWIPPSIGNLTNLVYLDLSVNKIVGWIPPSIGNLTNLVYLDLSYNNIVGWIPPSIGNLTNLVTLDLSRNNIVGWIPPSIGNLTNLVHLDLSMNNISGYIPETLGTLIHMEELFLSNNHISGQIPKKIGKLHYLQNLDISYNNLSGQIPTMLGDQCNLTVLDLSHNNIGGELTNLFYGLSTCSQGASISFLVLKGNNLTGIIPSSMGQLSQLHKVDLSSNSLAGNITEAHFLNLTSLSELIIASNSLNVMLPNDWRPPFSAITIDMSFCHLRGKFPEWFQTQQQLQWLYLSGVGVSGSLPIWFSNFSKGLEILNLSSNFLTGQLPSPPQFILDLSNNSFVGPIPSSFEGASLTLLSLSHNHINGDFPPFFCNMHSLEILDLSNNYLIGKIPNCHNSFPIYLRSLHLNNNNLSGTIPSFLKHCNKLITVDLGENKLFSKIPTWIGRNHSSLKVLRLRSNLLYGTIPENIVDLTSLQVLDLSSNNLFGSLPSSLGNFNAMVEVQNDTRPLLQDNNYTYIESSLLTTKGSMVDYTTILSLVTSIDLSNNHLSGEIPKELTKLLGLRFLNLSNNHLTGRIPEKMGDMKQLESLDLSVNNLTGEIPSSFSAMSFLARLNLSYNNLSGKIPTSGQLSTFGSWSYVGNKDLCGTPLPDCPVYQTPPDARVKDDEKLDKLLEYTSIVVGFVVGFWLFIGTLIMKQAIRFAFFRWIDKANDWIYVQFAVKLAKLKSKWQTTT